jgi:CRP-like cAMP-binding protein
LKKGKVIFEPSKNLDHVYLLLEGVVKVIAKVDENREVITRQNGAPVKRRVWDQFQGRGRLLRVSAPPSTLSSDKEEG